jgi:carboxyl-terminal processing protease
MRKILLYIIPLILALLIHSCKKEAGSVDDNYVTSETLATNQWIYQNMDLYYLWNDKMPTNIDNRKESDPEAYFYKLLYKDKDKWSSITSDYSSLEAELSGVPLTMGYSPAFYLAGTNKVIIIVEYVYPGSSAAAAGLQRGDIIMTINNSSLDTTNYYTLFSGTNYSVQLGTFNGSSLIATGKSLSMSASTISADPAIYHKVFDIDGHKIGYLVYVEFIAGENDEYLAELDNIFDEFKTAAISDLIVDLRYNPGGDVDAAIHMASGIAPLTVASSNEILVNLKYNTDLQNYLETYNRQDYLHFRFTGNTPNLNMNRVFFLTTSGSASASELLITGLDPYMKVIKIGEATYGKYAGSWVIPDDYGKWAIMPVVMKYANAKGYTDFTDGLTPDYAIDDDLFSAAQFGDPDEPMVAKAIEICTGKGMAAKRINIADFTGYKKIIPREKIMKSNMYRSGLKIKVN